MELIKGHKEGSVLYFQKGKNTIAYDLKDLQFKKKKVNGEFKTLKGGHAFFRKFSINEVAANFVTEGYGELMMQLAKTSKRKKNVVSIFEALKDYQHLESYTVLGIPFSEPNVFNEPASQFPKEVLAFLRESRITIDSSRFQYNYRNHPQLVENLCRHIRTRWSMDLEVYRMFYKMMSDWYDLDNFAYLVKEAKHPNVYKSGKTWTAQETAYGCEYKTLFDYLVRIVRTEACPFDKALSLYKDYLRMTRFIERAKYVSKMREKDPDLDETTIGWANFNKVEKYPKYLKTRHDVVARNYKDWYSDVDEEEFAAKVNPGFEYQWGRYQMVAPVTSQDVKNEGTNLHHCVASYIERIMDGTTQILFMRSNREESLVTVEVRNNAIVQARGYNNRSLDNGEKGWLKTYAKAMNLQYGDIKHNKEMPCPPCKALAKWDSWNSLLIELGEMVKGA